MKARQSSEGERPETIQRAAVKGCKICGKNGAMNGRIRRRNSENVSQWFVKK